MSGTKLLSAFLIMVPATILLTAEVSLGEPAAEACKASPGGAAPRGAHWYYHIDRATKQHCWYLGQVGGKVRAQTRVAGAADPVAAATPPDPAETNETMEAAPSAPAQTTLADGAQSASAQTPVMQAAPPQIAPPQVAAAQAAPAPAPAIAQPATAQPQVGTEQFGTRWPEHLPKTEELLQSDPAPVSNSYAERHEATATGPLAEAGGAAGGSMAEKALRYFLIAGMVAIPLLLLAGWLAKYARKPLRSDPGERVQPMAARPRQRRRVVVAEDALDEPADQHLDEHFDEHLDERLDEPLAASRPVIRRASSERTARAVTDPAQVLKASLSELMRDLRRAEETGAPKRRAAERANGAARDLDQDHLNSDRLNRNRLDRDYLDHDPGYDGEDANDRALGPYLQAAE